MKRNASVEMLRCVLMYMIVLWHCYYTGVLNGEAYQGWWSIIFVLLPWHVDCFVAVSGWYGVRFSPSKFLRIWGQVFFYSMLSILWVWISRGSIGIRDLRINGGWFANSYLFLMFCAPLVNACIHALKESSPRRLLILWSLCAVGVTLFWLPVFNRVTSIMPTGGGSVTFLTMLFVYVSARVAHEVGLSVSSRTLWWAVCGYCATILLLGGGACLYRQIKGYAVYGFNFAWMSEYHAPHVWILAIVVGLFFATRVNLGCRFGRFFSFVAPSMFGVYLFHNDGTSFGRMLYCFPEQWMIRQTHFHPLLIIAIVSVAVFGCGLVVDLLRRGLWRAFDPWVAKKMKKMDLMWERLMDG